MMLISTDNKASQRSFVHNLNIQTAETTAAGADTIFAEAYIRVCLPNDLAIFCLTDAVERLQKAGLVKRGVKRYAKLAQDAMRRYERALDFTLSGRGGKTPNSMGYFMDIADKYFERMQVYTLRLRVAIKNFLDIDKEPLSEPKSYALLANAMLHIAVMQFDTFFSVRRTSTGVSLSSDFAEGRLQGVFSAWRTAVEQIDFKSCRDPGKDRNVDLGVQAIISQMNNVDLINACGEEALAKQASKS